MKNESIPIEEKTDFQAGSAWKVFIVFNKEEEVSEDWVYALGKIREVFFDSEVSFIETNTSPVVVGNPEKPDTIIDIQSYLDKHWMGYLVVQKGKKIKFLGDHGGLILKEESEVNDPIQQAKEYFGM